MREKRKTINKNGVESVTPENNAKIFYWMNDN